MPLPFFTSYAASHYTTSFEPIYKNLFEIVFSSVDLSTEERDILKESAFKIHDNRIHMNISISDDCDGIPVLSIMKKLKKFSLEVNIYNKAGVVIGKTLYRNCKLTNFVNDITDFCWESVDILKPEFNFNYESSEYIDAIDYKNYKRTKKLERLLG